MNEQNEIPQATTAQQPQQFANPGPVYQTAPLMAQPGIPQPQAYPPGVYAFPQAQPFVPPQPPLPPLPQQPTYSTQPQAAQHSPEEGYIPKRLAAVEAYKHLRTMRTMGFGLLVAPFLVSLAGVFHPYAGLGLSAIASAGSIFFIYRSQGEMKRLETKYAIDPKAIR